MVTPLWRSQKAGTFAALLLSLSFAQSAYAAEEAPVIEYGLVDVVTGSPASGKAIPVEPALYSESEVPVFGNDLGVGIASYYGERFAGRPTASGALFDPGQLTAAHRTLPFGSRVLVTSETTGKSVVVTINDRGPYHGNRVIDLSKAAAGRIGLIGPGSGPVSMALLSQ